MYDRRSSLWLQHARKSLAHEVAAALLLLTLLPDIGLLNAPPAVGRWQGAGIADHDLLAVLHLDPAQRRGASAGLAA